MLSNARFRLAVLWLIAGSLMLVGVATRIINAFQYRILWGFDARYNWRYIRHLLHTWELPAPDAGWSTSHPPLFYYLSAAFSRALGPPDRDWNVIALRLMISAIGLVTRGA